jgi:hypothetical protein
MADGIMVVPSKFIHARFFNKFYHVSLLFNGSDINDVGFFSNNIPCKIKDKLFYYFDPIKGSSYFMAKRYDETTHLIEQLKMIFGIISVPYDIGTVNGIKCFLYECYPEHEHEHNISNINPNILSDNERFLGIFHWLIGVKGKYWMRKYNECNMIYSIGPYLVDDKKSELTKIGIKRFIPNIEYKRRLNLFFNTDLKKEQLCDLLFKNHYNWYMSIINRLLMLD